MSTMVEEVGTTRTMIYPDISFQGLFNEKASLTIDRMELDQRTATPNVSAAPEYSPSPLPIHKDGDISSFLPITIERRQLSQVPRKRSAFLELPLEVRLQIYSHLLPANPAKHAHLSPSVSYPPATSSAYFLRALSTTLALSFPNFEPAGKSAPTSFVCEPARLPAGSKGHGCGFIPCALLSTCKQVYEESRMLPWQKNEYVFINWFCSGVYAARAFLRSLKPWQRTGMRWARVEVLGRDLKDSWVATMVGGRAGGGEWKDLCQLWAGDVVGATEGGLWGLRLGIKGRVGSNVVNIEADGSGGVCDPLKPRDRGVLDVEAEWVASGLSQMKALRWLELDIEDDEIERDDKVAFCVALGKKLSRPERKVDVLFVEKVAEKAEEAKQDAREEISWGEPADDYIWGLDS